MQYYPLILTAEKNAEIIHATGAGFWYESVSALAGDSRIVLKPEMGNEVVLKPGQSVKLTQEVGRWFVRSFSGSAAITASIIVGSGEFQDNNATISAPVSVNNFPATQQVSGNVSIAGGEVEIKNDAGNPIPVTISAEIEVKNDTGNPLTVQENLITSTASYLYSSGGGILNNVAQQIVAPADNTAGIIIHNAAIFTAGGTICSFSIIAKNAAPANSTDGNVLVHRLDPQGNGKEKLGNKVKIPAGQGLYFICTGSYGGYVSGEVTYTKL